MKALRIIAPAVALILAITFVSLAHSLTQLKAYTAATEAADAASTLAASPWRSDEPPMSQPIIGLWLEGEPRVHMVVMVYGAAYPFQTNGVVPIEAVEYNAPSLWQPLP